MSTGEVHIWWMQLQAGGHIAKLAQLLSPEEHAVAARYRVPADRRAYISDHAQRRLILAEYVGVAPGEIAFRRGAGTKPRLADHDCEFSASRTRGVALLAVSMQGSVGVDVESAHSGIEPTQIANVILSRSELRSFAALSEVERLEALMAAWTRKEAVLKAKGVGLAIEPNRVEVGLLDDESPVPVRLLSQETYRVVDLPVGRRRRAAVAMSGTGSRVVLLRMSGPPT